MLNLRTSDGIALQEFREVTGFDPFALFGEVIERHTASGFLTADRDGGGSIHLTPAALPIADSVMADFVA